MCDRRNRGHDSWPRLDAERIRLGTYQYRLTPAGKAAHVIWALDRAAWQRCVCLFGRVPSTGQHWRSVARPDLAPIAAALTQERAAVSTGFELAYAEGEVTGTQTVLNGDLTTSPIRARVPDHTIDQRVDWAAVLACELRSGEVFTFHVFDPGSGVSLVRAEVMALETVHVPLGAFETLRVIYEVEHSAEAHRFEISLNPKPPRMLVKEAFPWGWTRISGRSRSSRHRVSEKETGDYKPRSQELSTARPVPR